MNDLLTSKQLLEKKIELSKSLIARKKKDFDYHTGQANEAQLIIEGLQCEQWKDQSALNAVNEEISKVPTLARQEKTNPIWKEITAIIVCLLLTSFSFAQPFISGEVGSRLGVNAGYTSHNIIVKGGALIPYTRRTDVSNVTYADAGYSLRIAEFNITPLIGISHYHVSDFSKGNEVIIDKNCLIKSLEIGRDFTTASEHYGNYYLFISQAYKTFFGAGLRVYVK